MFQYRKRYGLHAMSFFVNGCGLIRMFQYRKRYGLHAMQVGKTYTPEACKFQYRKRYGLHAMRKDLVFVVGQNKVSIPQAVWIACN